MQMQLTKQPLFIGVEFKYSILEKKILLDILDLDMTVLKSCIYKGLKFRFKHKLFNLLQLLKC